MLGAQADEGEELADPVLQQREHDEGVEVLGDRRSFPSLLARAPPGRKVTGAAAVRSASLPLF